MLLVGMIRQSERYRQAEIRTRAETSERNLAWIDMIIVRMVRQIQQSFDTIIDGYWKRMFGCFSIIH